MWVICSDDLSSINSVLEYLISWPVRGDEKKDKMSCGVF